MSDANRKSQQSPPASAVEAELIKAILARTPEPHRSEMARALNAPGASFRSEDPEMSRLLTALVAARSVHSSVVANAAVGSVPGYYVRVTVALVQKLDQRDARAVVLREPGDGSRPLLLLLESANAADLHAGLRAAALSVQRLGKDPTRREKAVVTGSGQANEVPPSFERQLARLRASAPKQIRGLGSVRSVEMATPAIAERTGE